MLTFDDLEKRYSTVYLPSKGIYYANKCDRVKLYHIDGSDVSVLTDANLAANGDTISVLLTRKVVKADDSEVFVRPDEMVIGDRMTLLIMLRLQMNPIYQFPLIDPVTNQVFTHELNLTTLSTKNVDIVPDENGLFTFTFKKSLYKKDKSIDVPVKFRLLTGADEKLLRPYEKNNQSTYLMEKLIMVTKSAGDNEDKAFIRKFLEQANLEEIFDFNKYTQDVMPGLDLNLEIPSPGGGIVKTFFPFTASFFLPRMV